MDKLSLYFVPTHPVTTAVRRMPDVTSDSGVRA